MSKILLFLQIHNEGKHVHNIKADLLLRSRNVSKSQYRAEWDE